MKSQQYIEESKLGDLKSALAPTIHIFIIAHIIDIQHIQHERTTDTKKKGFQIENTHTYIQGDPLRRAIRQSEKQIRRSTMLT